MKLSKMNLVKLFLIRKQFNQEIAEARKGLFARGVVIHDPNEIEVVNVGFNAIRLFKGEFGV